ncbi:MAG: ATP-binding cassette domain-containing protein [Kangiellaceae bacterium]|jgi:ATP-binding cassette subfamily F protein uup|nr:ATP-binding cassette domain-containing protein [Kangiellaceae bacterium]
MAILRGDKVSLNYGTHILLDNASFSLQAGQKIAIVGKNGAGKSSLMKLIAKINLPDSGEIQRQKGLRVRYLAQSLPAATDQTVFDYVANGVADIKQALDDYQHLSSTGQHPAKVAELHDFLDRTQGWHWQQKVDAVLSRLQLDGAVKLSSLSGGWRRRVSLAECLASDPDLLLLDEPTNHLDLATIEWLEQSLGQYKGAMLLISHDRQFIDAIAENIWEIDRGAIRLFPAPYEAYVDSKEKQLADEAKTNAEFDKKLAKEEVWIRQGIKARRTRNEGRVRALKQLRREHAERRELTSAARLNVASGKQSGKKVAEMVNVGLKRGDKQLFSEFSTTILKGDKIGIIGANGSGKSSFIKMMLGELAPTTGTVALGSQLDIAYFDQMRSTINPQLSIFDNVGEGRDFLEVNGQKKHVISYLADYGFGAERMQTPASALSGGEVSRLVLAKLFTHSANLLILDEPTNDLDIETLELLESQLVDFAGTVLVISHDRRFLDNVAASLLVFEGEGESSAANLIEIEGGFQDYLRYRESLARQAMVSTEVVKSSPSNDASKAIASGPNNGQKPAKLSYKYQRELDGLPTELEAIESDIDQLEQQMQASSFQQKSPQDMQQVFDKLAELQESMEQKMNRWEQLEAMKSGS